MSGRGAHLVLWGALAASPLCADIADLSRGFEYADRVVVKKSERKLYLMKGDEVMKSYDVRLGKQPVGHKQEEGDLRTPEGVYRLGRRNSSSSYFLSIQVSYPNEQDRAGARERGVAPGGAIMIHGQPNEPIYSSAYYAKRDWTDGCIAVSDPAMVEIWLLTRPGTPVEIRP
ncbi:MAG: L,D-transpeptidase family protein [Gammaproteobacteria bacterium]|nr:L,D-transpeptidase family protein [Gammaproteobacteria bacterium]